MTIAMSGKTRGLYGLNLVRRDKAVQERNELGRATTVSVQNTGREDSITSLNGDTRFSATVDSLGGHPAKELLNLAALGGELVVFGSMIDETPDLDRGPIIFNGISVAGFWASRTTRSICADQRFELFAELIGYAARGKPPLPAAGVLGLDELAQALQAQRRAGSSGKIYYASDPYPLRSGTSSAPPAPAWLRRRL